MKDLSKVNYGMNDDLVWYDPRKKNEVNPYCCPVCFGKGMVNSGFYLDSDGTSTSPEMCRSCNGRGYIFI